MFWETIAEGPGIRELRVIEEKRLPKGTHVRFVIKVRTPAGIPTARVFDLPGAEAVFRPLMPEGLELLDVHSPDDYETGVVEARVVANPIVTTSSIVAFIAANWFKIAVALGIIILAIRVDAEAIPRMWAVLVIAIAVVAIVFILTTAGVKAGKVRIGGT